MTNPEKISFESRRIGQDRYEMIPRRNSDMRLFAQLTPKQQTAYNLIEEGYTYDMSGLPTARMRYTDAPTGYDYELTPRQMEVLCDYQDWRKRVYESMPACHYAVLTYMKRAGLKEIEGALRIHRGKAARYISIGLNEFCIMKGWGDQENPASRRVRITGHAEELKRFHADYVDDMGRPVAICGNPRHDAPTREHLSQPQIPATTRVER